MEIKGAPEVTAICLGSHREGFLICSPVAFHTPPPLLLYRRLLSFAFFQNSVLLSPAPTWLIAVSLL